MYLRSRDSQETQHPLVIIKRASMTHTALTTIFPYQYQYQRDLARAR